MIVTRRLAGAAGASVVPVCVPGPTTGHQRSSGPGGSPQTEER
jgi:hypothetical protein